MQIGRNGLRVIDCAEYSAAGMSYASVTIMLGIDCRACKRRTTSAASHLASTVRVSETLTGTASAGYVAG